MSCIIYSHIKRNDSGFPISLTLQCCMMLCREDVISLQVLGKFVDLSLMEAHKKNLASIAIPALGTGTHGVPPEVSAEVMFDEVCEFCRLHPRTSVKDVRFVVYPSDVQTVQVGIQH